MDRSFGISLFHNQFKLSLLTLSSDPEELFIIPQQFQIGVQVFSRALDQNGILIDFGIIKLVMKKIVKEFNSKMIVSALSPGIFLEEDQTSVKICKNKEIFFQFPREKCILLERKNKVGLEICKKIMKKIEKKVLETEIYDDISMKVYIVQEGKSSMVEECVQTNFNL